MRVLAFLRLLPLLICLALVGCSEPVEIDSLSDKASIELIVALNEAGIKAERTKQGDDKFKVYVPQASQTHAFKVLKAVKSRGLPDDTSVVKNYLTSSSFIPQTPQERELRELTLLSVQVQEALRLLPNIEDARVFVSSSQLDDVYGGAKTVNVLLLLSKSSEESLDSQSIERLIRGAFPEGQFDLAISTYEGDDSQAILNSGSMTLGSVGPFSFRVPDEDQVVARVQIFVLTVVSSVLGIGIGAIIGMMYAKRRK